MVQSRHRLSPLPRICRATSSVSDRGEIPVLHSLTTLYIRVRVLNPGCPTCKESGDPAVPAQGILAKRQVRWIPPVCGGPGTIRDREIPCCTKVELFK